MTILAETIYESLIYDRWQYIIDLYLLSAYSSGEDSFQHRLHSNLLTILIDTNESLCTLYQK